jgi:hypothetical protein
VAVEILAGMKVLRSRRFTIGDVVLDDLNFVFMDNATEPPFVTGGYLGNDFLNKHRVLVDFEESTLRLQKSE